MKNTPVPAAAFADTKPHYELLDGLRGVAALTVICFHLFESFATSHIDQRINHGYLAVDFFFILSGFVIGYAYDDRWGKGLSVGKFLKRRLIRLHPMVVFGALIGAAVCTIPDFAVDGYVNWSRLPLGMLLLATLMNAFMIPMTPGFEFRGFAEMYPLNGPTWSLFFEYIGNLLYALFIRRFSTIQLAVWVGLFACGLALFAIHGPGDLCYGFSLDGTNFLGGMLRLLFAFSAGLLLSRLFLKSGHKSLRGAFWWCSLAVVALLAVPRIGGTEHLWRNGIYDTLCAVAFFPLIVWIAAAGKTTDRFTGSICKFLGDISYPVYIVHYPFIYLYLAWVRREGLTFQASLPGAVAVFVGSIVLAYLALKLYDEPVRKRLTQKFLGRKR